MLYILLILLILLCIKYAPEILKNKDITTIRIVLCFIILGLFMSCNDKLVEGIKGPKSDNNRENDNDNSNDNSSDNNNRNNNRNNKLGGEEDICNTDAECENECNLHESCKPKNGPAPETLCWMKKDKICGAQSKDECKGENMHYCKSKIGSSTDVDTTSDVYKFNVYFGRETNENNKMTTKPPYYTINNIDLADLKGEIAFFSKEILNNQKGKESDCKEDNGWKNCNRTYDVDKIDKWLIKYKPYDEKNKGKLNDTYISIVDNKTNANTDTLNNVRKYPGSIGHQVQTLNLEPSDVTKEFGNWLSVPGDCVNKENSEKCIGGKYSKNCKDSNFNSECYKHELNLNRNNYTDKELYNKLNTSNQKNMIVSGVCPDNVDTPTGDIDCQIVPKYIGTIRLNDLGYNIQEETKNNDECTKHIHSKLKPEDIINNESTSKITDVDLPFWQEGSGDNKYSKAIGYMLDPQFWCKQTKQGDEDKFVPITPNYEQPTHRIEKGGFVSINA